MGEWYRGQVTLGNARHYISFLIIHSACWHFKGFEDLPKKNKSCCLFIHEFPKCYATNPY